MNTFKNRKVAAAILGLAVAGLAVDKLVLGGGASQTLAAEAVGQPAPNASPSPAKSRLSAMPGMVTVASQLETLKHSTIGKQPGAISDAFAPPATLAGMIEAEITRNQLAERQAKVAEQATRLRQQLRVTATRTSTNGGAMINGTLYKLGDLVSDTGFRLKEFDDKSVTLEDTSTQSTVVIELYPERASAGYRSERPN